jgi:hypothetical protein
MVKRRIFQWFTFGLLLVTAWMAFPNVLSDDTAVRKLAKDTVTEYAGCKDKCQVSGMRGDRGMVNETIEYDIDRMGHYAVACHRKVIFVGDYVCVVTEGKRGDATDAKPVDAKSATPQPSR